jgi:outer membrane protein assembly factor BamB
VYAIRASDGTEIWNAPPPFAGAFLANNPTIAGDTLIVGYAERFPGIRGGYAAYDANDGRLLWARDLSPLVAAGKLARSLGNAVVDAFNVYGWVEHGDIVALDRQTGQVVWHRAPTGTNETNWRQMSLAKRTLVVASFDGQFEGINPIDGEILWTKAVELGSVLQPTSTDGESVFAIGSGALAAIDPSNGSYRWLLGGNGQSGIALYGTAAFDSQAVYAGGNGLWKVRK